MFTFLVILSLVVIVAISVFIYFKMAPQIGATIEGDRLARVEKSQNFRNGIFMNTVATDMTMPPFSVLVKILTQGSRLDPDTTLVTWPFDKAAFQGLEDKETSVTWFGHSSFLLKVNGSVFLMDPVFSERASMFSFMGPERFDYSHTMEVDMLPTVDAVILSHDHYDHLDYKTIMALKEKVKKYYVPLGVGAHLESWGIPTSRIVELDWWDEVQHDGEIKLIFTPSRHFSGRTFGDRFKTLWGAWVIQSREQNIFFGGDSGYFEGFKEIGEKYGPFDFAMLECGQYSIYWPDIHMAPELTAQAGEDLKAKRVMPIHWGKFTLSIHHWTEPAERFIAASKEKNYEVILPIIGETFILGKSHHHLWWREGYNQSGSHPEEAP